MGALSSQQIPLEPGNLHIWRVSLAMTAEAHKGLEIFLSAEERLQCARFVRAADRTRCAASRGSLRAILAKYIGEDPRSLPLTKGSSGKPCLAGSNPPVQFNASHAGNLALIAITRECRVGIDIERIRDVPDMESILESFFSLQESACIRSKKGTGRLRAFFLFWTRREAAAKALGIDLFDCFQRVVLPTPDRAGSGFRVVLPDPDRPTGAWWMRDVRAAPGYAGAVCTENENLKPLYMVFRP